MATKKILIIEDEPDIIELLTYNLRRDGFDVFAATSGEAGIVEAGRFKPDLIILDIMLPGINGLDVCREIRTADSLREIPIIMLTARSDDADIVSGLELGADDYLTKPFSPRILIARIRAVLRRRNPERAKSPEQIEIGEICLDQTRHRATVQGEQIDLTPTEFILLVVLAGRPGWLFSRSQLIDRLRDGQHVITDRAIDVQVANLRKKLGPCSHYIETVRGFGYRMQETV